MKVKKSVYILLMGLLTGITAFSNPATFDTIHIKQKDNRPLSFRLYGDEWLNYGKTLDGYTVLTNKQGIYCYAVLDKDRNLTVSDIVAVNEDFRSKEELRFLSSVDKNLVFSEIQITKARSKIPSMNKAYPLSGNNPLLVILVNFQDRVFSNTREDFQNLLSEQGYSYNGAYGSVKDYYYDNSFGQLNLNPRVVGPVTLPNNMAYYGAHGDMGSDQNPMEMISQACQLIEDSIDFRDFDIDNDGILDAVHVIFAGAGEATTGEADAIWPHRWTIYDWVDLPKYFDGIRLLDYSCSAEKGATGRIDAIGTICHEFGHVLGLPDYYDADYGGSGGTATALSSWSIMASGSYNNDGKTPPLFNANERMRMGWNVPDTLKTANTYFLPPLIDSNKTYILTTGDTDDYYLIENRSLVSWDSYLPNKGMLIYHIKQVDESSNCVNCDPLFQYCDIVEADNDDSQQTLAGDVFTTGNYNDFFTDYSAPFCFRWSDMQRINKPITRIAMDSLGTVSFRYLIPDTLAVVRTQRGVQQLASTSFIIKGYTEYDGLLADCVKGFVVRSSDNSFYGFYSADNFIGDTFTCNLTNLNYAQTYYFRAVAVSGQDTAWANREFSFFTPSGLPFFVINADSVRFDGFNLNVTKTLDGDFPILNYGVVYDTLPMPDMNKTVVQYEGEFSDYTVHITNIRQATRYYCRAFAETVRGITYSPQVTVISGFIPIEGNEINTNDTLIEQDFPAVIYGNSDLQGGENNYTFLWQQYNDRQWKDAEGINWLNDYSIDSVKRSASYRRVVFSGNVKDTSNAVRINVIGDVFNQNIMINNIIELYPTISNDCITLHSNGNPVTEYCVLSLDGKILKEEKGICRNDITVKVNDWEKGTYIVIINGNIMRKFTVID